MIDNSAAYAKCFVEYEILLHSLDEVNPKELINLETKIQEFESNLNMQPSKISHAFLLTTLLEKSNLTQSGLADALDVSQPLINRILRGNVLISKKLSKKLATYFRLDQRLFEFSI